MHHKQSLIKLYKQKMAQIDEDITLKELLQVISQDIANGIYDEECNVLKNTTVDNIGELKSTYLKRIFIYDILYMDLKSHVKKSTVKEFKKEVVIVKKGFQVSKLRRAEVDPVILKREHLFQHLLNKNKN